MYPAMDSETRDGKQILDNSPGTDTETNQPTDSALQADQITAEYEEMFASRFTKDDPFYLPYINKGMDPPPIVENYQVRRPRPNWRDRLVLIFKIK